MHPRGLVKYANYLFDLDGTIYLGDEVVPGASMVIQALRERGKKLLFATNSTLYTREEIQAKLTRLDIDCKTAEIITAATASSMYFRDYATGAKVLLFGGEAMREELARNAIEMTYQADRASHVLVGLDKTFDFEKLTLGMKALRNGARLIAANPDPFCPTEDGPIPDTWSIVKAIETASGLSVDAIVGKPSKYYADYALKQLGCRPEACLMVGDRLDTDIVLGIRFGMRSALVLTGADNREGIRRTGIVPDYVLPSIRTIVEESGLDYAEKLGV